MVPLELIHKSNARLRELGPGLVALFTGGTSGIGEHTLKAFVQHTVSPHVYLVGRSETAAERIIKECKALNTDGKVEFIKADLTDLGEVDRVCKEVVSKEQCIHLIVQTQGNLAFKGRDESPEGLDRKFVLNYYSRMRFIHNLLPQLKNAASSPPHFSRALSVLGAGNEGSIDSNDLELKKSFSAYKCAAHTTVMNDFMVEELASRNPHTAFVHSSPGFVFTQITRDLPFYAKALITVIRPILGLLAVSQAETGARQLFLATSGMYRPAKPYEDAPFSAGVPVPEGLEPVKASDGLVGSGGYIINWDGASTGKQKILKKYRDEGISKKIYEHTVQVFERVELLNREQGKTAAASV